MMGGNGPRVDRSMSLSGAAAQAIMNSPTSVKSPRETDAFRETLQVRPRTSIYWQLSCSLNCHPLATVSTK